MILFAESRETHLSDRRVAIGKTYNVFACDLCKLIFARWRGKEVAVGAVECVEHIVEREHVVPSEAVVGSECRSPVVVACFGELVGLFAGRADGNSLAKPVVSYGCGVDIGVEVAVVVSVERHIKSLCEKVALAVFQRPPERIAVTMFLSEYDFLSHTGLHFLIHVRIVDAHQYAVGPAFIDKTEFSHHSLIMIFVIEAIYTIQSLGVE